MNLSGQKNIKTAIIAPVGTSPTGHYSRDRFN